MAGYLYRRQGGTYFFRRAIPERLRPDHANRREWIVALGTKDRSVAKRLIPYHIAETDRYLTGEPIDQPPDGAGLPKLACFPPAEVSERIKATSQKETYNNGRDSRVSLTSLFDKYADGQQVRPTTAAEGRSIIRKLTSFIGHDDARRLSVLELDRWRDHLLCSSDRGKKPRSARTVKDKYISVVRSMLSWAVDMRIVKSNVARHVAIRVPRAVKLRERDFTKNEATRILRHSLTFCHTANGNLDSRAKRWIPWLCAYTGARLNEISQLRGSDVQMIDGFAVIIITPEAGTVKTGNTRIVPIHPHLIEQGFMGVAERAGDLPIFYDPSAIRISGPSNRYYKKVGERVSSWVRMEVGIKDKNVQPSHGWRHMFKSLAITAKIPERVADAIQGHAPRSIGQAYGRVPLAAMVEAINRIPRFTFEPTNDV